MKKAALIAAAVFLAATATGVHAAADSGQAGMTEHKKTADVPAAPHTAHKKEPMSAEEKAAAEAAKKIIVARVNGTEITMASLLEAMNRVGPKGAGDEAVKREALDKLIVQDLALQSAKKQGITVRKEKIDAAIKNLKDNVGGEEGYKQFLESENVTEGDLRAQVDRSLTLETIYAQEVLGKVHVPEEKMKEEYEKEKSRYILPEKALLTDVLIFSDASHKDAGSKAEALLKKIKDNDNNPWKLVLDGTFIVRDYVPKKNKENDKPLVAAVKNMKPGELSGIIKAGDGLHILKLEKHEDERQATYEEAKGSIEPRFRFEAQQQRLKEWIQEMRKGAKIEIIEANMGIAAEEKKAEVKKQ